MKNILLSVFSVLFASTNFLYSHVNRTKYDNGFTVIHLEKKGCGLVNVVLFLRGGSFGESDEQAGISNLAARLLLKGTVSRDAEKIAFETESLGATLGAGSSNDYTEISMIVPVENFTPAFSIFCDIVNNPAFPENESEKEKEKIIAGIKSKSDRIFDTAYDRFNETIYAGHPYHKPPIGYEASVSSLTLSRIKENYRKNFRPENMVMSVAGDISEENIKKIVFENFGKIKIFGMPATAESVIVPTGVKITTAAVAGPVRIIFPGKFQQSYYFCGFLAPDAGQIEYPVLKLINGISGGGMGARIFKNLRERSGLVYEADSFYPSRHSTGAFAVYAGTSKENIEKVERIINEEIKKLPLVDQQELNDAREYLKGTYLIDHRTIERQAWYLGWWEIMGKGFEYDRGYIDAINSITVLDIKNVCEKYLTPDKMTTVIVK